MNAEEETGFLVAIGQADLGKIRFFLDNGADPNYRFSEGSIPVVAHYAFDVEVLKLLLEYGVNLNAYSNSPTRMTGILSNVFTNLHTAKAYEILDFLIENGAVPSEDDLHSLIGPRGWAAPFTPDHTLTYHSDMQNYLKGFKRAAEAFKIEIPAEFRVFEKQFYQQQKQYNEELK